MDRFSQIKKELKAKGISIVKANCLLNGQEAYRIVGSESHNSKALWTKAIIEAYYNADF